MKHLLFLLSFSFAFPLTAHAVKDVDISNRKLTEVNWGEALDGDERPAFDAASLVGKVVIIEEFGVKTPACLVRIKELARLAKKLERDGTKAVIVAIHRQRDVPDETILKALKKARVTYAVRKNGFLPASIGGMPHAAIFHPDGSMAWHGDSTERDFERALAKVLEAAKE